MPIVFKFRHVFLFFFIFSPVKASYENTYIKAESINIIKNDSPSFIDLMVYIPLLNRVVEFCEQNKDVLSINLAHGLFLLNVNLVPFVMDDDIPDAIRIDLEILLTRSNKLQNEFNRSTKGGKLNQLLSALASNATSWSKRVQKLNFNLLTKTYAHGEYPDWNTYQSMIEKLDKGTPKHKLFTKCLVTLLQTEENLSEDMNLRCEMPNDCYKSIVNGSDFGYWLTHRLLLIVHARLSRNCAMFSAHEDQIYRIKFCEKLYREAEYIALNGFQLIDLLLEQIALCALDGNAQFLRRSWLMRALEYQQQCGCFQLVKLRSKADQNIDRCNDHATSVAVAAYAAATRLILENFKRINDHH